MRRYLGYLKRVLKWLALVVLILLSCLLTCEVFLRCTIEHKPNLSIYELDEEIGKRLKPNFEGDHYGVHVEINAHGMRDREFALKRPAGTKRILALGDSWTFGAGVATEETWPKRLEAVLAGGSQRIEVMNTGVSGYETCQEAEYYKRDLKAFDHDLVLVGMYPVNDVHDKGKKYARNKWLRDNIPLIYDIYMAPRRHLYVMHWFSQWRKARKLRRRAAFYGQAKQTNQTEQTGAVTGASFAPGETDWTNLYTEAFSGWRVMRESLESIGETADACGVRGAVVLFPDVRDLARYEAYCHPKVRPLIEKAVRDAGLAFIDSLPFFLPYKGRETEIALDNRVGATHLNAKGYDVLARGIAAELQRRRLIPRPGGADK